MIDVRLVRNEPDRVRTALARRHQGLDGDLDTVIELDTRLRSRIAGRDEIRARVKALSKEVGQAKRDRDDAKASQLSDESRALGEQEASLSAEVDRIETQLNDQLLRMPNLPAEDCPDGEGEHDNVTLRMEGYEEGRYREHNRIPHWDIGAALDILDLERGAKLSGSMFVMYRGLGAALVRALCQFALDRNADLYEEVRPPTLVRTDTMVSTGHLPKFIDEAYQVERDGLWAIPTAEVPLTSLCRDELLAETDLPKRLMAHTSCFRREAGSAGRDTRGLLRVHEFDKVEILAYCTPEQAGEMHQELLARAERNLSELGLAYRVVDLCTGDIGNSAARTFDLEAYAPGCDMWLEVSSVSWFTDYQARRANVRYRPTGGGSPAPVHTLNGSALAVPRVWAALVETYRQADGSVTIPEVLQPYMRGVVSIPPAPS